MTVLLSLLACAPRSTPPDPPVAPVLLAAGAPCVAAGECASGICEGEGCTADAPGTCIDPQTRACTRDLRAFCGCDGVTFRASGTCPMRRYARPGPCEAP